MKRFLKVILSISLFTLLAFNVAEAQKRAKLERGAGEFEYSNYKPLSNKMVTVFYYIPLKGDIGKMPILFATHGANRTGAHQLESWRYFAEERGFIVIAPQFAKREYSVNEYQFGGVSKSSTNNQLRAKELWSYNIIEALFDYFKESLNNSSTTYDIWGHSAGGQFVHRFLLTMPQARVNVAVASNAGSYTFPFAQGLKGIDGELYGWPYSVKDTPFASKENLKSFFSKHLIVHAGNRDTSTVQKNLPKHPAAKAQGIHRFERAHIFYQESKKLAEEMGVPFNWELVELGGVAHRSRSMVYGTSRRVDGKRVYSTSVTKKNGAYNLIYGRNR
ncbi:MAG: alpha/beta hydrolase-fold protein [Bacteroidales bacterium]